MAKGPMTVEQLRKALEHWPPSYRVAFASHDNDANEVQGYVHSLRKLEEGRAKNDYGPTVVLRP